jgi:hypothetical protein
LSEKSAVLPELPPGELIAPSRIESPLASPGLLPPGKILLREGRLLFYPEAGLELLPAAFRYSGFWLGGAGLPGAAGRGGAGSGPWAKTPHTGLHGMMPGPREALDRGARIVNMEEVESVKKLVSGQSLEVNPLQGGLPVKEIGLYYKDLPLCRLKVRGRRAFI